MELLTLANDAGDVSVARLANLLTGTTLRGIASTTAASSSSAENPWSRADGNEFIGRASATLCGITKDSSSDLTEPVAAAAHQVSYDIEEPR
eukprot:5439762-Lingulodinium_polyedra.AAC.1